jgi:hypothetical protein
VVKLTQDTAVCGKKKVMSFDCLSNKAVKRDRPAEDILSCIERFDFGIL